jgi:hypothetical protein
LLAETVVDPVFQVISLSLNSITSLQPFAACTSLKYFALFCFFSVILSLCIQNVVLRELFLRKNNVSDIQELRWLSGLQHLHVLWLAENPVTTTLNCA